MQKLLVLTLLVLVAIALARKQTYAPDVAEQSDHRIILHKLNKINQIIHDKIISPIRQHLRNKDRHTYNKQFHKEAPEFEPKADLFDISRLVMLIKKYLKPREQDEEFIATLIALSQTQK